MMPTDHPSQLDSANGDGTGRGDGWAAASGTSAAAPQIAGVVALLMQRQPGLSPGEIKALLRSTARDVTEGVSNALSNEGNALSATRGPDSATGAGLVDAWAAILQAGDGDQPETSGWCSRFLRMVLGDSR